MDNVSFENNWLEIGCFIIIGVDKWCVFSMLMCYRIYEKSKINVFFILNYCVNI